MCVSFKILQQHKLSKQNNWIRQKGNVYEAMMLVNSFTIDTNLYKSSKQRIYFDTLTHLCHLCMEKLNFKNNLFRVRKRLHEIEIWSENLSKSQNILSNHLNVLILKYQFKCIKCPNLLKSCENLAKNSVINYRHYIRSILSACCSPLNEKVSAKCQNCRVAHVFKRCQIWV
jgi:hypothetical protein